MEQTSDTKNSIFKPADDWLDEYKLTVKLSERGNVVSVGDGITWISGLPTAAMDEVLYFEDGSRGVVFELTHDLVGAVLLHETEQLSAGTAVHLADHTLDIPVGDALLGRVLDPLGNPLDADMPPTAKRRQPIERQSPPITERDDVQAPLYTGNKIIDTMIPVGKGQRQLIVGDEGLGRTALAIDTVINQKDKHVYCVYVLIGQKRSTVVNTIELLKKHGAMSYTTVVVAEASSLPGLQHLAPYAGCAIAEFWMQQGLDTLVVYDDLSTHAKTYRELSLLLRRPPGREAYPGDIFYVHARLLERATCYNAAHGGGSMTALPIIETQQGEIASYIPTNLISITDGQIYLDRDLFVAGYRPAIDIARSVSRIGGQAQHERIKEEAARIKLNYLQFLELEVFTRFGAKLETSMELAIKRGRMLRELLKQDRLTPYSIEFQLAWLIAFNEDLLSKVSTEHLSSLLDDLDQHIQTSSLNLESPRAEWVIAIRAWLQSRMSTNNDSPS